MSETGQDERSRMAGAAGQDLTISPPIPSAGGLTSDDAARRLKQYGPNAAAEERSHPVVAFLGKFWAPVPWMLELTVVLELALGRHGEAVVIGVLLLFNALLAFVQENRAQTALSLLRQRLSVQARALRDGRWRLVPAKDLVPDDVIHVRMGDLAPADIRVLSGQVLLDQSALTGESVPVDVGPGQTANAGTVVKRGEATGQVTATGARTAFGKTVELVRLAKAKSHLEVLIFAIVRYLVAFDMVLVAAILGYAFLAHIPAGDILPFALILLVASIPVALPATFTVATAFGALELVRQGVLVTHLAAIEEAAAMDVLCSDKTGTLTENRLSLAAVRCYPPYTEEDVLRLAAIACDDSTQDPIDLAILAARRQDAPVIQRRLVPFDPATKRSEAFVPEGSAFLHVVKGAPQVVAAMTTPNADMVAHDVADLAAQGNRVLAVAAGRGDQLDMVGLVALQDPPREDSARLVGDLHRWGVRVLMVTGDTSATAAAIAGKVGIGSRVAPASSLRQDLGPAPMDYDVFAGVLPEDKLRLIRSLQQGGHTTGMTGDGVNDAPALKQAEVGVAVASATDVAKAAASLVLTSPGLRNMVAAVQTSRRIYQRMLTYTLNKIIKTIEIAVLLSVGLMLTGQFVTTPTLIVLLLFTNDFVTMSIATDRAQPAPTPQRWHVRQMVLAALSLGGLVLLMSFAILFGARDYLQLPLRQLQTLIFVMLVFGGQGTLYMVREHRHFWSSAPSRWLLLSSALDVCVVTILATFGILMTPIPLSLTAVTFLAIVLYLVIVDFIKVRMLRRVL
jgi:H+-transporting ATPase